LDEGDLKIPGWYLQEFTQQTGKRTLTKNTSHKAWFNSEVLENNDQ